MSAKTVFCLIPVRPFFLSVILLVGLLSTALGYAWLPMDRKTIDAALVYGMKNKGSGLSTLLGDNWVEGDKGSLLNIYSPFMLIASKAAKADFPRNPSAEDLKAARKKFRRDVYYYADPKNKINVKFAVSFYGHDIGFAQHYQAKIVGFGRGKTFEFSPVKERRDKLADPVKGTENNTLYQGINAYYFRLKDLDLLEQFDLVLSNKEGESLSFRLQSSRLY